MFTEQKTQHYLTINCLQTDLQMDSNDPPQIPTSFLEETDKLIIKFILRKKDPERQNNFIKENEVRNLYELI